MTKIMRENLPYRSGVGIMLLNAKNMVFVGRRIDTTSDAWQMPQGGIDEGELPAQAAMRELEEEVGTNKAEILAERTDWLSYDLPDRLIPRIWHGKYRGQKQRWFAMRFLGADSDININTKHPEFCQWQWSSMADLPGLIVPFKRDIYKKVVAEFTNLITN
jgi:putative (di)nucleoside polyphosphate hydrolase